MVLASRRGVASIPARPWLMSQFWQKEHSRLQPAKKIVPEPLEPTRGRSSPK
jgi:hypothetical protein